MNLLFYPSFIFRFSKPFAPNRRIIIWFGAATHTIHPGAEPAFFDLLNLLVFLHWLYFININICFLYLLILFNNLLCFSRLTNNLFIRICFFLGIVLLDFFMAETEYFRLFMVLRHFFLIFFRTLLIFVVFRDMIAQRFSDCVHILILGADFSRYTFSNFFRRQKHFFILFHDIVAC